MRIIVLTAIPGVNPIIWIVSMRHINIPKFLDGVLPFLDYTTELSKFNWRSSLLENSNKFIHIYRQRYYFIGLARVPPIKRNCVCEKKKEFRLQLRRYVKTTPRGSSEQSSSGNLYNNLMGLNIPQLLIWISVKIPSSGFVLQSQNVPIDSKEIWLWCDHP